MQAQQGRVLHKITALTHHLLSTAAKDACKDSLHAIKDVEDRGEHEDHRHHLHNRFVICEEVAPVVALPKQQQVLHQLRANGNAHGHAP